MLEQRWNFLRLMIAWNTSAVDDGARDKENSNKAICLDSYIHRHFLCFPTIADFDHLENRERNKLVLETKHLAPAEINVCTGNW